MALAVAAALRKHSRNALARMLAVGGVYPAFSQAS